MRRSDDRILTTHTGSLPRPAALTRLYARRVRGEPVDPTEIETAGREALRWVVPRQVECGIDVINNGEQQRESFVLYLRHRLSGLGGTSQRTSWEDIDRYPEFKADLKAQAATKEAVTNTDFLPAAIGEVRYLDASAVEGECADFRAVLPSVDGRYVEVYGEDVTYTLLTDAEELLEMLGAVLFVSAFLSHLRLLDVDLQVRWGPRPEHAAAPLPQPYETEPPLRPVREPVPATVPDLPQFDTFHNLR